MKVAIKQAGGRVSLETDDKYAEGVNVEVDCEKLIPICKASCCKLSFYLSAEDVTEGVAEYERNEPYHIKKDENHVCVHLDKATQTCGIHEQRPGVCRLYDCRKDGRIWLDFEKRIINPEIHMANWPKENCSGDNDGHSNAQATAPER